MAKLSQVLDKAKYDTVCTWIKYNQDSSHEQQGLTGLGSPILPTNHYDLVTRQFTAKQ